MLFKILKRSFWDWWDNLSYSILTSFLGGSNPFFLVFIATFIWTFQDFSIVVDYPDFFFVLMMILLLNLHVFPTTLAAYSMQNRLIDKEVKRFFAEYWQELKKYFGRALLINLVNTVIASLLAYSMVYYNHHLPSPFNYILIGISGLFYFVILLSQLVMTPLLVADKYPLKEYYLIAIYMTVKKGFVVMGMGIFNVILLFICVIPGFSPFLTVVPLTAYIGLASTLQIWTFRYLDGQVEPEEETAKRSMGELFSPLTALFRRPKKKEDEDDKK